MKRKMLMAALIAVGMVGAPNATLADTGYVAQAGQTPLSPYASWTDAASNIQEAVAVVANTLVLVSNGTYNITSQIAITNAMILRSMNGATNTIVRRNSGATRIFCISNNATLDGFTIRDGNGSANGGGIYMTAGTVQNCVIISNSASLVSKGGGICMAGSGLISNCVIAGNFVTYYDGGGLVMTAGLVVNCIIMNNTAVRWGGGIATEGSGGAIRNCLIAYNKTTGGDEGFGGGGISCYSASPTIESCTIVSNVSATLPGGGVASKGVALRMTNSIVYFNTAPTYNNLFNTPNVGFSCSPELVAGTNGNLTLDPEFVDVAGADFRIRPGSICMDAGTNQNWMTNGVDLAGVPRLRNGRVDIGSYQISTSMPFLCNFRTAANVLQVIFTPYVSGPDTNITWCGWDFTNGGSYNMTVTNLAVVTNVYSGSGLYSIKLAVSNASGNATSVVKTIRLNTTTNGVVYVSTNGLAQWPYDTWAKAATNIQDAIDVAANTLVLVSNGTYGVTSQILLDNNTVLRSLSGASNTIMRHVGGSGDRVFSIKVSRGGIMVTNAVIDGFTIRDGNTSGYGGGIELVVGTVQNCVIIKNTSAVTGGGIYMTGGVVSNCVFGGNAANYYDGGGVNCGGGKLLNCIFTNNTAARWGGGIGISGGGPIRNCLIARNTAPNGGGVGCQAVVTIESCSIVSNSAVTSGGGIYIYSGRACTTNTIVYFNKAVTGTNFSGTYTAAYSCAPELIAGSNGNITADPLLKNLANGDYRLTMSSPCVNTGTNQAWMTNAVDLDGNRRLSSGRVVDMGAYELPPPPGTIFSIR